MFVFILGPFFHTKSGIDCDRTCNGGTPYHCIFYWKIKNYDISYDDCTPADTSSCIGDGIPRQITMIVDQEESGDVALPAKPIHACYGDMISVSLANELKDYDASIHWHGLHMKSQDGKRQNQTSLLKDGTALGVEGWTPWADGVPFVTQCPIKPTEEFTWYTYNAIPAGTHWFHSHTEFQRDGGANGALVIREHLVESASLPPFIPEPPLLPPFLQKLLSTVCDRTDHHIVLQEWYTSLAEYRYHHNRFQPARSILVNGRGRSNFDSTLIPWQVFNLDPINDGCTQYRFRLISSASLHCPIQFSIEDHVFTVVATDGQYIDPLQATTITIANGERYDIVIDTQGMEYKTYQMQFAGAPGIWTYCNTLAAISFLQYGDSPVDQTAKPNYIEAINVPGKHVNPLPSIILPDIQTGIPVTDLRAAQPEEATEKADKTFYLQVGDNSLGGNLNNIQFGINTLGFPLLSQEADVDQSKYCDQSYAVDGLVCNARIDKNQCKCFHILEVDLGDIVEIFILNPTNARPVAHTLHLHGHAYSVIGSGAIPVNNPMHYIKVQNEAGNIPRVLYDPPRKDSTQTIPGSYILYRFEADNPGYWIMHCHFSFDLIDGQTVVFKVGEKSDWSIPEDFPKC